MDRAYAVDLGGQIYRIDFESPVGILPANWSIYKLADLSGGTSTGRKFFYRPDALLAKTFVALMIGSGDREKPLLSATQDHFFQLFDRRTQKGSPDSVTPIGWTTLTAMGSTPVASGDGYYVALAQGGKSGQRGHVDRWVQLLRNQPTPGSEFDERLLSGRGLGQKLCDALFCTAATGQDLVGGGMPPSPVAGLVSITKADGTTVQLPFVIGAPNARKSAIEASRIRPTVSGARKRLPVLVPGDAALSGLCGHWRHVPGPRVKPMGTGPGNAGRNLRCSPRPSTARGDRSVVAGYFADHAIRGRIYETRPHGCGGVH